MEKIESLMSLYRKDKITDYVIERELAAYMGNDISVKFSEDSKATSNTFGFFALPERLVEGLHITFIVDKNAFLNFYSDQEIQIIVERLKMEKQHIYKKYMEFISEGNDRDISFDYAMGFLLNLYSLYKSKLIIEDGSFLIPDDELLKYIDKFSLEIATNSDVEAMMINQYICQEIVEFAKKYVKVNNDEIKIKIVDINYEMPQLNLGMQEIRKYANPNYIKHQDIPYDYKPETNQ